MKSKLTLNQYFENYHDSAYSYANYLCTYFGKTNIDPERAVLKLINLLFEGRQVAKELDFKTEEEFLHYLYTELRKIILAEK